MQFKTVVLIAAALFVGALASPLASSDEAACISEIEARSLELQGRQVVGCCC